MTTKRARFRFYAELNDFLPRERRFTEFVREFELSATVKDMIEALGVPHTEVDLVLVDGKPVDFSYTVRPGDRISVYPVFESFDISGLARLRPEPLRETRFVVDANLGQLARYLRLLGFDSLYRNDASDEDLARASRDERRVLLTRDVGLLKRKQVTHGYFVRATDPPRQTVEVVRRFDLVDAIRPLARCLNCNGNLAPVDKDEIRERLPERTALYYDDFRACDRCGQVYWKGSHYDKLARIVEQIRAAVDTRSER